MTKKNFLTDVLNNYQIDPITGCWIYQGEIDIGVGYGRVMINGRRYHVHRLSAFYHLGLDIDDPKQFACHIPECPNRSCINFNHLYVGDNQSNQRDVLNNKCKQGHELVGDALYTYTNKYGKIKRMCRICNNKRTLDNYHKRNVVVKWDKKVG